MFPPMCLPAAEESQELNDVLSESQMEVVENGDKYQVKFFAVELFEKSKIGFRTDSFSRRKYAIIISRYGKRQSRKQMEGIGRVLKGRTLAVSGFRDGLAALSMTVENSGFAADRRTCL